MNVYKRGNAVLTPHRSDTLIDRHLLPQMHTSRHSQERKVGQVRGALHETVRGPLLGRQHGCAEGARKAEAVDAYHGR